MMLINREYTRIWVGQTISLVGDFAFDITVLIWIATVLLRDDSRAPAASSGVLVVIAITTITVGPLAGVFVDRWEKKRVMLAADLIRAGLVGCLTIVSIIPAGWISVPVMLSVIGVAVALNTAVSQFFGPARLVMVSDVVPSEQLGRASSYAQSAAALAAIIGPPIAAPMVVLVGVQWALAFNAISFLLSFLAIKGVSTNVTQERSPHPGPQESKHSALREFRAGLQSMRSNHVVSTLLAACVLATLGTGAVNALEVYFVQENLHANVAWFGVLAAVFGGGTLAGALAGGFLGDKAGHARIFKLSLLLFGVGMLTYSRLDNVVIALAVNAILGISLGALNTVVFPLIMSVVPRDYLGRTMAVFNPTNLAASILSIMVAGAAASTVLKGFDRQFLGLHFGRVDSIFAVSGLLALAGAAYAFLRLQPANTSDSRDSKPFTQANVTTKEPTSRVDHVAI